MVGNIRIDDGRARTVTFVRDMMGQIIKRDERDHQDVATSPHEIWYRYAGRELGYDGNNGSLDTDDAASIANRQTSGPGAFLNGATTSVSSADFDLAYDELNSYDHGSDEGGYSVQAGDTLSSIASQLWGDASLWYKLAEINGLTADSELIEGSSLVIPAGVIRNTNNVATFTPYDPADDQSRALLPYWTRSFSRERLTGRRLTARVRRASQRAKLLTLTRAVPRST